MLDYGLRKQFIHVLTKQAMESKFKVGDEVTVISNGGYLGLMIPQKSIVDDIVETGAYIIPVSVTLENGYCKREFLAFFDNELTAALGEKGGGGE